MWQTLAHFVDRRFLCPQLKVVIHFSRSFHFFDGSCPKGLVALAKKFPLDGSDRMVKIRVLCGPRSKTAALEEVDNLKNINNELAKEKEWLLYKPIREEQVGRNYLFL